MAEFEYGENHPWLRDQVRRAVAEAAERDRELARAIVDHWMLRFPGLADCIAETLTQVREEGGREMRASMIEAGWRLTDA